MNKRDKLALEDWQRKYFVVRANSNESSNSDESMEVRRLDDIKEETFYLDPTHQNSPTPDLAIVEEIVAHLTRYREKEKKESR